MDTDVTVKAKEAEILGAMLAVAMLAVAMLAVAMLEMARKAAAGDRTQS